MAEASPLPDPSLGLFQQTLFKLPIENFSTNAQSLSLRSPLLAPHPPIPFKQDLV